MSSAVEPEGNVATGSASTSPSAISEPFPNCFSMPATTVLSAFTLSLNDSNMTRPFSRDPKWSARVFALERERSTRLFSRLLRGVAERLDPWAVADGVEHCVDVDLVDAAHVRERARDAEDLVERARRQVALPHHVLERFGGGV